MTGTGIPPEIEDWFAGRGWRVRDHQRAMLEASDRGDHALLVADTGAGKTLAGFLPRASAMPRRPMGCTRSMSRPSKPSLRMLRAI